MDKEKILRKIFHKDTDEERPRTENETPPPLLTLSASEYIEVLKAYKEYSPPSVRERFMRDVLGVDAEDLVSVVLKFPAYKHLLLQRAVFSVLKGWRVVRGFKPGPGNTRLPMDHMPFDVDYGVKEDSIKDGTILLQDAEKHWHTSKIVVSFRHIDSIDDESLSTEAVITAEKEQKPWLDILTRQIKEWMDKNNYLKGKKIKPDATFLPTGVQYSWDDLILPPDTRKDLQDTLRYYFEMRESLRANGLPLRRGIICHGPPGTGKTLLGKVIASVVDATFIWVTPADVKYPSHVREIFRMARELAPTVLFFEDIDMYATHRLAGITNGVLGEFLAEMDGFVENEDILVIATTNDIKAVEPAIKDRPSRFDSVITFPPMDLEMREKMLGRLIRGFITEGDRGGLVREVAEGLSDMTGAELKEFFISAVKLAIARGELDDRGRAILSTGIFREAGEKIKLNQKRIMGFVGG